MPQWKGSDRRDRLPRNWHRLRAQVRARAGGICEIPGCTRQGNQCDHTNRGDDHSLDNLQWLCEPHHRAKSSSEGGRAPRKNTPRARRAARATEQHPGIRPA